MNIYFLHPQPNLAARYHSDRHVAKMILEATQILATVHLMHDSSASPILKRLRPPMRMSHQHHPCVLWACSTAANYDWLFQLGSHLLEEYFARFQSFNALHETLLNLYVLPLNMRNDSVMNGGFYAPPLCMPDKYKDSTDHVKSYRDYYFYEKDHLARWSPPASVPPWWKKRERDLETIAQNLIRDLDQQEHAHEYS